MKAHITTARNTLQPAREPAVNLGLPVADLGTPAAHIAQVRLDSRAAIAGVKGVDPAHHFQ